MNVSPKLYAILKTVMDFFAEIKWPAIQALFNKGIYYYLQEKDHDDLRDLLKPGYYFILTRRKCHLTTYLISIASLFTTGMFSHYSHALMNVDDGKAEIDRDYKFIEATAIGVHFSTFMEIFDCDSVCLLKPKGVTNHEWVAVMDRALSDNGKEYDDLFDLSENKRLSCIELCRDALRALPDYETRFAEFESMIVKHGNKLTPQIVYDCAEFERIFEVRR